MVIDTKPSIVGLASRTSATVNCQVKILKHATLPSFQLEKVNPSVKRASPFPDDRPNKLAKNHEKDKIDSNIDLQVSYNRVSEAQHITEETFLPSEDGDFDETDCAQPKYIHLYIDEDINTRNKAESLNNHDKITQIKQGNLLKYEDCGGGKEKKLVLQNWYKTLSHTMTGFLEVGYMVDAYLEGGDGDRVPVHQLILAHISPLLATIISESRRHHDTDPIIILLPSVQTSHLREFIHAVYTGELSSNLTIIQNIFMVAKLLDVSIPGLQNLEFKNTTSPNTQESMPITKYDEESTTADQDEGNKNTKIEETDEVLVEKIESDGYRLLESSGAASMNLLLLDSNTCEISEVSLKTPLNRMQFQFSDIQHSNNHTNTNNKQIVSSSKNNDKQNNKNAKNDHTEPINQEGSNEETSVITSENLPNDFVEENVDENETKSEAGAVGKKSASKVTYQPADKPCPLCSKPRIVHKNREISEGEKGCHRGNYYKCCHCYASKLTAKKLFTHLENHVAKKFKCSQCDKGYSYKNLLIEHEYKIHGEGKDERFGCPYENCDYEARYKQTLHTHISDHHKQSIKPKGSKKSIVTCPKCSKSFKKQHYYAYHKRACQVFRDGKFECTVCQKKLNSKFALNKHMKTKHSEPGEETVCYCNICNKPYSSHYSLYNHRLFKHGVNSKGEKVPRKLFPCSICRKLLTTSVKLKTHIEVIHMGKRDFNCRFCSKQFTSKSNLLIHEGTQHTGVLPYSCDHCEKSFGRKIQLSVHREQVHGMTSSSTDPPPPSSEYKSSGSTVTNTNTPALPSNSQVMMSDMMPAAPNRFDQGTVLSNQLAVSQVISGHVIPEQLTSHMITDHHLVDSHKITDHQLIDDNNHVISDHQLVDSHMISDHQLVVDSHVISDDQLVDCHVISDDQLVDGRVICDDVLDTHVIEEIDRHVISEDTLNDAHYYVVNDVNGVQVGDVIIPMEFVEVIDEN